MLTFLFYFSFQTDLSNIIAFELHSNPVKLVGKVFIISNYKESFPKKPGLIMLAPIFWLNQNGSLSILNTVISPLDQGVSHLTIQKAQGWDEKFTFLSHTPGD